MCDVSVKFVYPHRSLPTALTPLPSPSDPSGKPTVIRTRSQSPHSIEVVWRPPDADTMNGEFIGHVLSYRPRDQTDAEWTLADLPGNANETTVRARGSWGSQTTRMRARYSWITTKISGQFVSVTW